MTVEIRPFQGDDEDAVVALWHVERMLGEAGCPKVNLQVRADNAAAIAFYEELGYTRDDVVSLGRRLERDDIAAQGDGGRPNESS